MTQKVSASVPIRVKARDGADGKDGEKGDAGPIIYPAGEYSASTTYTNDGKSTPYVLYNGEYYYLATEGSVKGVTPGSSSAWVKFDSFEAIFAKIGIIKNGLIGSAVFNGDWMFSQQGCYAECPSYALTDYQNYTFAAFTLAGTTPYIATSYQYVGSSSSLPTSPVEHRLYYVVKEWTGEEEDTNTYYVYQDGEYNLVDDFVITFNLSPTNKSGYYTVTNNGEDGCTITRQSDTHKIPMVAINFKTGECWFGGGNFSFRANILNIGNGALKIDKQGHIYNKEEYSLINNEDGSTVYIKDISEDVVCSRLVRLCYTGTYASAYLTFSNSSSYIATLSIKGKTTRIAKGDSYQYQYTNTAPTIAKIIQFLDTQGSNGYMIYIDYL